MSKPAKVLLFYYIFLGASSLILSLLHVHSTYYYMYAGKQMEFAPMIIPTIIGGIIALKLTIPLRSLKIFLIIYFSLWALRFTLLYIANKVGTVVIFSRLYHVDFIVANYYKTVSRLDTHLPFVTYWFINYFFTSGYFSSDKKKEKAVANDIEKESE